MEGRACSRYRVQASSSCCCHLHHNIITWLPEEQETQLRLCEDLEIVPWRHRFRELRPSRSQ